MTIAPASNQSRSITSPYQQALAACQLGQLETAQRWAQKAIEQNDCAMEACILLGQLAQKQQHFSEAKTQYKQAATLDPKSAVPDHYLGSCYRDQRMFNIAIFHFLQALNKQPDQLISRQLLTATLGKMSYISEALYVPQLERELLLALDSPVINHKHLFGIALGFIRQQPGFDQFREQVMAQKEEVLSASNIGILTFPLFSQLLQKVYTIDLKFEQLLRALRQLLLRYVVQAMENNRVVPTYIQDSIAVMATQVFINEYLWSIREQEQILLDQLTRQLADKTQTRETATEDIFLGLMSAMMYQPAEYFPEVTALDWSKFSPHTKQQQQTLEQCLLNGIEEQQLMEQLPSLAPITEANSLIVQQQYENYPYPRWLSFDRRRSLPFSDWVKVNFAHTNYWSPIAQLPAEVLVAGCGTGNHALTVSSQFTDAKVKAIDLSRRSLGYAMRMARHYQMDNIEFIQGDLLAIQKLGQQFSIIECIGTLHHMAAPMDGWRALCGVLRPGGLMKIGLYSCTARRKLPQFRQMAQAKGVSKEHQAMCTFRDQLLQKQDHPDLPSLLNIADFFTYNAFQDLLFHPQEHCFSIPQIANCLRQLGLEFLGFSLEAAIINNFKKIFPQKTIFDLQAWTQFEEQHPDTFLAMYQFWCQKPTDPN
ncbi:MAG: methyltransferase domain-containing protein [Bacteroidota bacterium]